jgi:hypothetical protein
VTGDVCSHAHVLGEAFGLDRSLVVPLRWEGVDALVFGTRDENEHRRRQRRGAGALRDYRTVEQSYEALLGLTGGPSRLDTEALRPPVRVDAVVVIGRAAEATIRRASYFAPVGRRIAVLSSRPRRIDGLHLRAMWLEVGLGILDRSGGVEIVGEPGERHGHDEVYRWWFAEAVYQAHFDMARGGHRV